MSEWAEAGKWALAWGPGLVILVGIYRLVQRPPQFIGTFIAAQQAQAVAMSEMATAVKDATARDNLRIEELVVNDAVILRRLDEEARRHRAVETEVLRRLEEIDRRLPR